MIDSEQAAKAAVIEWTPTRRDRAAWLLRTGRGLVVLPIGVLVVIGLFAIYSSAQGLPEPLASFDRGQWQGFFLATVVWFGSALFALISSGRAAVSVTVTDGGLAVESRGHTTLVPWSGTTLTGDPAFLAFWREARCVLLVPLRRVDPSRAAAFLDAVQRHLA